jgi:hypothetical protein
MKFAAHAWRVVFGNRFKKLFDRNEFTGALVSGQTDFAGCAFAQIMQHVVAP